MEETVDKASKDYTMVRILVGTLFLGAVSLSVATDETAEHQQAVVLSCSTNLLSSNLNERLAAIEVLAAITNESSRQVLYNHLSKIPAALPTTESRQTEKIAVVRALLNMMTPTESQDFAVGILDRELTMLKVAALAGAERYYPDDLITLTLNHISERPPIEVTKARLSSLAKQMGLPSDIRSRLSAKVQILDLQTQYGTNRIEQALQIVKSLECPPMFTIPWDIFQDVQRRAEYGRSASSTQRLKTVGDWMDSKQGIQNAAREQTLQELGSIGVKAIAQQMSQAGVEPAKKAYYTMFALETLRSHVQTGRVSTQEVIEFLPHFRHHFDTMSDEGAYSARARSAAALNFLYEKLGIKDRVLVRPSGVSPESPSSP